MTNTKRPKNAMYPLMLRYRLGTIDYMGHSYVELGFYFAPNRHQTDADRRLVADIERLHEEYPEFEAEARATRGPERFYGHLCYNRAAPKASLRVLAGELQQDAQRRFNDKRPESDFELLSAVIAKGAVYDFYGSSPSRSVFEQLHLLTCGIDWSRFGGVSDETWEQFAGTFASQTHDTTRLTASLQCSCDEQVRVQFGLEPPSVTQLFVVLSAGQLERLWEDS